MYIAEFEITDLRSFRGAQSISLDRGDGTYAGWTVFAGRNGAGKSTLLKALALSIIGPLAARSLAGVFSDWVRVGAASGTIATSLDFDSGRDEFQSGGRTTKGRFWTGLEWRPNPHGTDALDRWLTKLPPNQAKAPDRGPWGESPRGWFVAGYGPYRHLGPTTADIVRLNANPVLARLVNLFHEAATLSDAIEWLQQVHARALEDRPGAQQLRDDVLAFMADGLLPDDSTVERVDSDGLWVCRDGVSLPLEQVSDGYRTVAALVVDMLRCLHATYGGLALERDEHGQPVCPLPGVVLIDEVDAHMHVAWQQRIGFWLTRHFPNIQFLVTTHSPFICQAASPRGIIRLPAPGEHDTNIAHIDDRLFASIVNGGADEAVMTELFGLEHAHSREAEQLRQQLAELEEQVLLGTAGEDELQRYEELRRQVPDNVGELARRRLQMVSRNAK